MTEQYQEVTLKVPKAVVDFFKSVLQFTKNKMSLEELFSSRILTGLSSDIDHLNTGLSETFDVELSSKAYGLDKLPNG